MTALPETHVAILMATFNGAPFLRAQLDSFAAQSHGDWSLRISDDGSSDATLEVIEAFRREHSGRHIALVPGPGRGSTANFMSLLCDPAVEADFFALADQDDVWLPDHLERSLASLRSAGAGPALYGARTLIVDEALVRQGQSPRFRRPPDFRNALVQSLAGGNTMLLNAAARAIVLSAGFAPQAVCHDWWLYQVLSGAGAKVVYDPEPTVLYRQHGGNQIGSNRSAAARVTRLRALFRGGYRDWNRRNTAELTAIASLLTPENRAILAAFCRARGLRGFAGLRALKATGVYRQTLAGNLSLRLAAVLGLL